MNNTELKNLYKRELNEVKTQKLVLEQSIQSVTRREYFLTEALEKLGVSTPPQKGKYELDPKRKMEVLASLTR